MADTRLAGIGMTSARTRDRLVQRLREPAPQQQIASEPAASSSTEDTGMAKE